MTQVAWSLLGKTVVTSVSGHSLCCPLRGPLPKAAPRCVLLWGGWEPGLSLSLMEKVTTVLGGTLWS